MEAALRVELPTYSTRVNPRAKRMRLKVDSLGKVEVVIPKETYRRLVPKFVSEHGAWLQRTVARMLDARARVVGLDDLVPKVIELAAVGERWLVNYSAEFPLRVKLVVAESVGDLPTLRVGGTPEVARASLRKWLSQRAAKVLPPWLDEVSRATGLGYTRVTIRAQRSRWGSCSSRKSINLNRNLLFVRADAVQYLLVHELSHTRHLNHSAKFWSLVEQFVPNYPAMEAELDRASRLVPSWTAD